MSLESRFKVLFVANILLGLLLVCSSCSNPAIKSNDQVVKESNVESTDSPESKEVLTTEYHLLPIVNSTGSEHIRFDKESLMPVSQSFSKDGLLIRESRITEDGILEKRFWRGEDGRLLRETYHIDGFVFRNVLIQSNQ